MDNHIMELFDEYINKCDDVINSNSIIKAEALELEIIHTFESYNKFISNNLTKNSSSLNGNYYKSADYIYNIEILRSRLNEYKTIESANEMSDNLRENIGINIDSLVENAIKNIENNKELSEDEIKKLIKKIREIEEISKVEEIKNKKWVKLTPVMTWICTTEVSVATVILDLITAILNFK